MIHKETRLRYFFESYELCVNIEYSKWHFRGRIDCMKRQIEDSSEIEYDKSGHGRTLVLLHAFPLSKAMWRAQIDDLCREWKVIAPNFRGIEESSPFEAAPSVEQCAHDLAYLLEEMRIAEPVNLCGLSMGGYVALAFARLYPQRLASLILCDTRANADDEAARLKRDETIAFCQSHSAEEIIERQLPTLLGTTTRATRLNVVSKVKEIARVLDPQSLALCVEAMRDREDSTALLSQIDVPTLVLCGDEDVLTPCEEAKSMAAQIRNSTFHVIHQAGHLSNLENPAEWNKTVKTFLREL